MSRTPLDIIEADPSFTVGVRCDGRQAEIVISHNAVLVLKSVTKAQIALLITGLSGALVQVMDHEERVKNADV